MANLYFKAMPYIGVLALVAMVMLFSYSGPDDKYITYFVADSIAQGQGIANLNGRAVEQSSSFLFTYILGFTSILTGRMASEVGYFVSMGVQLLSIFPLIWILRRQSLPMWLALVVIASPCSLYWAASGMENSLYLLSILALCAFLSDSFLSGRFLNTLFCFMVGAFIALIRPEGVLVLVCAMLFVLVAHWLNRKSFLLPVAAIAGGVTAIAARIVSGWPVFPLPVYAKSAASFFDNVMLGMDYLLVTFFQTMIYSLPLLIVLVLAIAEVLRNPRNLRLPSLFAETLPISLIGFALAILSFSILSGGDWIPFGRFLSSLFSILLLLILLSPLKPQMILATSSLLLVASVVMAIQISRYYFTAQPFFGTYAFGSERFSSIWIEKNNPVHSRDIPFIDKILAEIASNPKEELQLASIQMGMVPYYLVKNSTKKLRFFDFRGLTTLDIHSCDAIDDPFRYNPYEVLEDVQKCNGRSFDYIYDLGQPGYVDGVKEHGCEMIFEEKLVIVSDEFRSPYKPTIFLADCSNVSR